MNGTTFGELFKEKRTNKKESRRHNIFVQTKYFFQVITQHVFLITMGHGNWDLSLVAEILLSDSEKYASYVLGLHNM
jgi:hypothetical protein